MSRVLTAMSGGVDSAVTAALLLEAGHTVGGATMALHEYAPQELADAILDARRSASASNFIFSTGRRNSSGWCRGRSWRSIRPAGRRIRA